MNEKDKAMIAWFNNIMKTSGYVEQIGFVQEIFYQLEEDGIELPYGDYKLVEKYLTNIKQRLEKK